MPAAGGAVGPGEGVPRAHKEIPRDIRAGGGPSGGGLEKEALL